MSNKKHYVITALVLGGIGALAALLISLTNMITKDRISENEKKKIEQGLVEIYNKDTYFSDDIISISDSSYNYLQGYYEAFNSQQKDNKIGYVFQASGKNAYGEITLLVGIKLNADIGRIYLVKNDQSYATTLVDNYVDPYNQGNTKFIDMDVSCGATYGATLIRNMVLSASKYVTEIING